MVQTESRKLTLIGFLIPLGILCLFPSPSFSNQAFAQSNLSSGNSIGCDDSGFTSDGENSNLIPAASASAFSGNGPYVSVTTDMVKYIVGDIVELSGIIIDSNGCALQQPVHLEVTRGSEVVYAITAMSDYDGIFIDSGLNADKGTPYMAPFDLDMDDPNISGIKMPDLRDYIDNFRSLNSKTGILIILDCDNSDILVEKFWR